MLEDKVKVSALKHLIMPGGCIVLAKEEILAGKLSAKSAYTLGAFLEANKAIAFYEAIKMAELFYDMYNAIEYLV